VTIAVTAARAGDRLRVRVGNHGDTPVPEAAPDPDGGLGLRNLRERLQARYGDAAHVEFGPDGAGMSLAVELPCAC
jgi:signal transduction histidine kinase